MHRESLLCTFNLRDEEGIVRRGGISFLIAGPGACLGEGGGCSESRQVGVCAPRCMGGSLGVSGSGGSAALTEGDEFVFITLLRRPNSDCARRASL